MSAVPLEKDHLKIHYADYNFEDGSFIKEIEINNDGYLLKKFENFLGINADLATEL